MFYRKENGVITGGPFNCEQSFPTEFLDDSSPEVIAFITPNPVKAQIAALEAVQRQKITDRAEREFKLAVFALTGQTAAPAFVALKAIDDQIKALRAQL